MSTVLDAPPRSASATPAPGRIRGGLRRILLAAFATALSVTALVAVVKVGAWLPKSLAIVVGIFLLGALGRALRVPRPVIVAVQGVVALCVVVALEVSTDATWGFVPGPGALADLGQAWDLGIGELTRLVPPDDPAPGITMVLLLSAAVTAIAVDALAAGYRRPDLAGLLLVVGFAVPAATLPNGWRGAWFLLPALGFLLLAFDGNHDRVRTWGEDTVLDSGSGTKRSVNIGAAVLAFSLAIPAVLPSVTGGLFNDSGIGLHIQEPIKVRDPLSVMRTLLVNPRDVAMFSQDGNSAWPDEQYLHAVTLEVFDGKQWRSADREVNRFDGAIPESFGITPQVPLAPVETQLQARPDADSDYAPMPRPANLIAIEGNWRLSGNTGDVLSADGPEQIAGRAWTVNSLDRDPDPAVLSGKVTPGPGLEPFLVLPALPPAIAAEARRITKGAQDAVEIGRKLQNWFASPKRFSYDLRPAGSGTGAISAFLSTKRGYAEQAAATVAVMARTLGIPARLAVGFTAGRADPDGARIVGAHDAHAWPELFLPEVGWTRFEPTGKTASSNPVPLHWLAPQKKSPPPKTDEQQNNQAPPPPPPPPPQQLAPQSVPNDEPQEFPKDAERNVALLVMAWTLLVTAMLAAPRMLRAGLTRRRWVRARRVRGPASAALVARIGWLELRDAAVDLGYSWPGTRTPRQAGQELAAKAALSPERIGELEELLTVVQQVRYAPSGDLAVDPARLRTAVLRVRGELAGAAPRSNRVRALVVPPSLGPIVREGATRMAHRVAQVARARRRKAQGRRRVGRMARMVSR